MRSGSGQAGPVPDGSVAVADRPALVPEPAPEFVYQPWKLKELRRLYANLIDGTEVDYLDLVTPSTPCRSQGRPGGFCSGGVSKTTRSGAPPSATSRPLRPVRHRRGRQPHALIRCARPGRGERSGTPHT